MHSDPSVRISVRPRRTLRSAALAAVLITAAGGAAAQETRPGLWEFKTEMKMPGQPDLQAQMAKMQEQLKNLPPEQRRMIEQQMGSMGVGLGPGGAIRTCVTPELARRDPIREGQREGDCTYSQVKRTGNVYRGTVTCTQPPSTGQFETTLHDPGRFTTRATMTAKEGRMDMVTEGRWVAADCGSVAPARGRD